MSLYNASEETGTPATPSTARQIIYPKSGGWYSKNAAGAEYLFLVNGGALGTPSSGDLSSCTSNTEAAANNSTQLATTAYADRLTAGTLVGAFTTLSASSDATVGPINTDNTARLVRIRGSIAGNKDLIFTGRSWDNTGLDYDVGRIRSNNDGGSYGLEGVMRLAVARNDGANNLSLIDVCTIRESGLAVTGTFSATTTLKSGGYTVATLPAGTTGERAYVTDATTPTYLGALTGGGAVSCPVYKNATAWVSA